MAITNHGTNITLYFSEQDLAIPVNGSNRDDLHSCFPPATD